MAKLPPGFTVVPPAAGGSKLPPGFTIDPPAAPAAAQPSFWDKVKYQLTHPISLEHVQPGSAMNQASFGLIDKQAQPTDILRHTGNFLSFNALDPALSLLPGGGTPDEQRAKTAAADKRLGPGATALDLGAGYVDPLAAGFKYIPAATKAAKIGLHTAEGGIGSGVSAYNAGKSWPEIGTAAAEGAGLTGAVGAVATPVARIYNKYFGRELPSTKQLTEESRLPYKSAEQTTYGTNAKYPPAATTAFSQSFDDILGQKFKPQDAAQEFSRRLRSFRKGGIDPIQLEELRGLISSRVIRGGKTADPALGNELLNELDRFTTAPANVPVGMRGPEPSIRTDIEKGRTLTAQAKRAKTVEAADTRATRAAQRSPGVDLETRRRANFGKISDAIEADKLKGYSPEAQTRIKQIADGTVGRNVKRALANTPSLPAGIQALAGLGTAGFSLPITLGMSAISALAQRSLNKSTGRDIQELQELMRTGKLTSVEQADKLRQLLARMAITKTRENAGAQ
jgi:hypothetical protein